MTENESQVQDFISKETNATRKTELQTIFEQAKALKMRFDNHKMTEISESAEYKSMASRLCTLIQKQRHAGRKLFMSTVSNPLLGFDCVTFFYYPTIRGVKSCQLQLMDDFISSVKGIKSEYTADIKPIGLVNVPKSERSREIAGNNKKQKIKISHADFKNDVIASLASILTNHKVPIKWLDHNIDTSELPNAFSKKANILININLVVEMTTEPLQTADSQMIVDKEDDEWSADGWFDDEAQKLINKSRKSNDSLSKSFRQSPDQKVRKFNNNIVTENSCPLGPNRFSDLSADSSGLLVPNQTESETSAASSGLLIPIPTDSGISIVVPPSASTPVQQRCKLDLPKPNDSLVSSGLPEDILELGQIHTAPLETPRIKRKSLTRSRTMEPSLMPNLSDAEDDIPQNRTMPESAASSDAIASQRDIEGLLHKLTEKFESLEKSINKN